jgi:tetratricopeptide (TPR) repeat protein
MSVVLHLELGFFTAADAAQAEASRLATETAQPVWNTGALATGARTAALHEDLNAALTMAADAIHAAGRNNDHLCCAQLALGTAHAIAGEHVAAYEALRRMLEPTDPAFHWREGYTGITLLAETARPAGQLDDARKLLARLEETHTHAPCPMLHVHLLYARAC